MVSVDGIAGDDDEDASNQEYAVYDSPPGKGGKLVGIGGLYLRNDAGDEGDEPRKLGAR